MSKYFIIIVFVGVFLTGSTVGQEKSSTKKNSRPVEKAKPVKTEPFEKAAVEEMAKQCVKFETEAGAIEAEMLPESAPESVRNFLNLAATGAFDTTTFSRVVPGFVIQGGNLSTGGKWNTELAKRAQKTIPDEPSQIRHERGILSMARPEAANSATTHFFILVGRGSHLDGTFAAFGRVRSGMEVVDAINKMPVEGETPLKPVRVDRAGVFSCPAPPAVSN